MKSFLRLSLAEQTAAHLRAKLHAGHWGGKLPGVIRLCTELQVSEATMRAAFRQLEAEGLLAVGGQRGAAGRWRRPAPREPGGAEGGFGFHNVVLVRMFLAVLSAPCLHGVGAMRKISNKIIFPLFQRRMQIISAYFRI